MKAAVYSSDGLRLADASRPLPYSVHSNSRVELLPDAVNDCFRGLLGDLCRSAGISLRDIRKVSFTSQAQTFTVLHPSGHAQGPFLGWADARATQEASELQETLGEEFHSRSGSPSVKPTHMISKVLWWKRVHGLPAEMRVASLPSYLAMQLGAAQRTDTNLAAMSGFYSIPDGTWCPRALMATGIQAGQLGGLVKIGEVLPGNPHAQGFEFAPDLEVVMAGNDHTAGAVGSGCSAGRSILTLGTAGVLYRHAGNHPGPYSSRGLWGPYPGGGHYELLVLIHACSALDWADDFLHGGVDSMRFIRSMRQARVREDSVIFSPDEWGSAQAWKGEGILEEKAYAVLEGIAFSLRRLAGDDFCKPGGGIVVLGGGSRLDEWVQLVANIFDCQLVRSAGDGLDGAAAIAGVSLRGGHPPVNDTFFPDSTNKELLSRRFQRWKDITQTPDTARSAEKRKINKHKRP
ncbi:MAG: FGGY family carbohydrate kinase [Verrucomicrobia bacterium]|nr:FGGY family carbohydrate kinase [Verrucomicrobiota bacterium]